MSSDTPARRLRQRVVRGALATGLALSALTIVEVATAPVAAALQPPVVNTPADHVSADALPTVQINGVVWDQEIIGNTVYVVGQFTQARPAGSPAGVNETARANVLAYNLTTGALIPGFVANTNNQVRTVTRSPDGTRLYIGGQFTQVNGTNRFRLAALNPTTGAVIPAFNASTDYIVYDLFVTGTTVYAGGAFNFAGPGNSFARSKLAAFQVSNGAVTGWAPTADATVRTLVMSPDGSRLFAGGHFFNLNGQSAYGMGALNPADGTSIPWAANQVIRNGGSDGAILHLYTDGTSIYGNGYTFGRDAGNLEGIFKAHPTTGAIQWVSDCHGDTYQSALMNGHVYTASHAHFCGNTGGFPQSDDEHSMWGENMRHSLSFRNEAAGTLRRDNWNYHNLEGLPAPSMTSWFPEYQAGTFTGQGQAVWAVEGNGQYLTYGGEFTRVNAASQQGLVRFAVRSLAPNTSAPRVSGAAWPIKVVSESAGQARITAPANFDRDDGVLTYQLLRDGVQVATTTERSTWYDRPAVSFVDSGLAPGSTVNYSVRARDPNANALISQVVPVVIASSGPTRGYANRVLQDGPALYWRLGDAAGTGVADDSAGQQVGAVNAMTFGRPGAIVGDPNTAASPDSSSGRVVQPELVNAQGLLEAHQARDEITVESWFRTTSNQGGRILGFGSGLTGNSSNSNHDRLLYVSNQGRVLFGVRTRPEGTGVSSTRERRTIQSDTGLNDGDWHHVVGTLNGDGMRLYVDGTQVASRTDVNSGHGYYGYWRVGADVINTGWTSAPSSTRLNGDIDEAAVYYKALTPAQITAHWTLSGHGAGNVAPIAEFTSSTNNLNANFNATGSSDADGNIVSYAWNFGDGTPNGSGVTTSHPYAASGTYTVTLTVTDDDGATDTEQHDVTVVAANVRPVAAYTVTPTNLTIGVNGSGSTDSDGTIQSYAWTYGDGGTGSGVTDSHTYAAPGTYTVTLTVTDDDGATDGETKQVTVTAAPVLAADTFERTVANGLGTADTGGAWTSNSPAANHSVSGGAGRHRIPAAGGLLTSYLNAVSARDVVATVDVAWDKPPTTGGQYASLAVRRVGTSDYRVRVRAMTSSTSLTLFRIVNNVETSLAVVTVPGLVYNAGDVLRMQLRGFGTGTTTLQAKVWKVGTAEPAAFQVTANDTTAGLQGPGGVGLVSYLSGSATNAPLVAIWDNLLVMAP